MKKSKLIVLTSVFAVLAMVFVGCGGDPDNDPVVPGTLVIAPAGTVGAGEALTVAHTGAGSLNVTLTWQHTPVDGERTNLSVTGNSLVTTNAHIGTIRVVATASGHMPLVSNVVEVKNPADLDPIVPGTLVITPAGPVTAGATLTVEHTGGGTVSATLEWRLNGTAIDPQHSGNELVTTNAHIGTITVVATAAGYRDLPSNAVIVQPVGGPIETTGTGRAFAWMSVTAASGNDNTDTPEVAPGIVVTVKVVDGVVTEVEVPTWTDTRPQAAGMPAAHQLVRENVIANNITGIDAIAAATMAKWAVKAAATEALLDAGFNVAYPRVFQAKEFLPVGITEATSTHQNRRDALAVTIHVNAQGNITNVYTITGHRDPHNASVGTMVRFLNGTGVQATGAFTPSAVHGIVTTAGFDFTDDAAILALALTDGALAINTGAEGEDRVRAFVETFMKAGRAAYLKAVGN